MSVHQQIVRDKTSAIAAQLDLAEDEAFLRYVHALITGDSALNVDEGDLVDGGQCNLGTLLTKRTYFVIQVE